MMLSLKQRLRAFGRHLGYEVLHRSCDPVLNELLHAYNELRLNPQDALRWDHRLARLASLARLRSLLGGTQIDLLIDVGANRGQFVRDARRVGYTGEILSFEPLRVHQNVLQKEAARDGRWRVLGCGLGDSTGEALLNVYHDDLFSSLHAANASARQHFGHLVRVDHAESVSIRRLDDVLAELGVEPPRRVFLKTDTQGHDLAVLAGAERTLTHTYALLAEASVAPLYEGAPSAAELDAFALARGFVRAGVFPIGYAPDTGALLEFDSYYCRPQNTPATSS